MSKRAFFLTTMVLLITCNSFSQRIVNIYGFIKDKNSGEVLPGATVYNKQIGNGTVSDYNGYFNLRASAPATITFSYVGYSPQTITFNTFYDSLVYVHLEEKNTIEEIVISEKRAVKNNISTLSAKEITHIPSLGGKPDVAKALQWLPGINFQTEGSSLLQVRGGDPGQNQYLFDNIAVIYVNHLGGFSSVFNPDIINNIDVYKGAFPARYGGKLSSVVDITQKRGNSSKVMGNYSLGITDASFCIEGPTKIANSSFIVTARKTLTDPLLYLATTIPRDNGYSLAYGFHDVNGKFTWNPNDKNSLIFNLYYGDDYLKYWQNSKENSFNHLDVWGNVMLSAHWSSVLGSKLYSSTSVSISRYRLKNKDNYSLINNGIEQSIDKKSLSSVRDFSLNSSLKHTLLKNIQNEYGLKASEYTFLPFYQEQSFKQNSKKSYIFASELAAFASTNIRFLNFSNFQAGLRAVAFNSKKYCDYSLEPRINLNLGINAVNSINAGFMRTKQYAHLLLSSGSIMLNEVWIPSDDFTPPSSVTQYNLGYLLNLEAFSMQIDLYSKEMTALATYKDGYTVFEGDVNWQSKIENWGVGKSYGAEIYLKKELGNITGFAGYTISKTTRKYPNINMGKAFVFDYDRTHSISVYLCHKLTEKLDLNLSWTYQTGVPYTPAMGKTYTVNIENGQPIYYEKLFYGEKNSGRMRAYHRLDIGINYTTTNKKNRKAIWNFSVYNLYNRQNPYYYYYNTNNTGEIYFPEGNGISELRLYQMTLFPFMPSVSYKVFFEKGDRIKKKKKLSFKNWLYMES